MNRNFGKTYLVKLLRSAYLTQEASTELYEFIKEDIIAQLEAGHAVNLFGLVNLVPHKLNGKQFKGFLNSKVQDNGYRVRPIMNRAIKQHFREVNSKLGGRLEKIDDEDH